ncbi:hypothetical protein QOT17_022392 [Balamuthia mandrillaris]
MLEQQQQPQQQQQQQVKAENKRLKRIRLRQAKMKRRRAGIYLSPLSPKMEPPLLSSEEKLQVLWSAPLTLKDSPQSGPFSSHQLLFVKDLLDSFQFEAKASTYSLKRLFPCSDGSGAKNKMNSKAAYKLAYIYVPVDKQLREWKERHCLSNQDLHLIMTSSGGNLGKRNNIASARKAAGVGKRPGTDKGYFGLSYTLAPRSPIFQDWLSTWGWWWTQQPLQLGAKERKKKKRRKRKRKLQPQK